VRWHPFQLNPDLPAEGVARADYLRRKFGTPDPGAIYQRVSAAARAVGLEPDFAKIARQPNTLRAHALIAAAAEAGGAALQERMVETLFRAYFVDGADLTSRDTLAMLARRGGLADDVVAAALDGEEAAARAGEADSEARSLGVSGVPLFVIDGKLGVSGAQGADALLAAFAQARSGAAVVAG
jgi:predicted DsbA family dithiol-disulfide isomerase